MSKLFKLKPWVSSQQALDFLSLQLGESLTPLDLLQLVVEKKLKISVKLDNRFPAKLGKVMPMRDVPRRELPNLQGGEIQTFLDGYCLDPESGYTEDTPFVSFSRDTSYIDGIWDLAMMGNEAIQVANALQDEIGAQELDLHNIDGTFLCRPDGTYANLHEKFGPDVDGFYPADGLPDESVLVFRPEELNRFVVEIYNPQRSEKPLETKERNTLLTIIAALCQDAGHDYARPSKTALAIQSTLDGMGISLGESTIRGHLKDIANALESRMK